MGLPWLERHNPAISRSEKRVDKWSTFCLKNCLHSAVPTILERGLQLEKTDLSKVPSVDHDLAPMFSKRKTLSLFPHHPYDCAINRLPSAPLPTSRLYNLSGSEIETKNYIEESL